MPPPRTRLVNSQRVQNERTRNGYSSSSCRNRRRYRRRSIFYRYLCYRRGKGNGRVFARAYYRYGADSFCDRRRFRSNRFSYSSQIKKNVACFIATLSGLCVSAATGIIIDIFAFKSFSINYLLIGMTYSAIVAGVAGDEKPEGIMKYYSPLLNLSFIIVIVNLGLPLDYRLIAGAGLFTAIYILSRAAGKIGGAFLGGKITHAEPAVTKYLGFTLLPHSGVSLVFTGIAVSTLNGFDPSLANIVSGTIVSAAVINEIIAVITTKIAFKKAGEIPVLSSDANSEIK